MIKIVLDKTKDIISYKYDQTSTTFMASGVDDYKMLRDVVRIVNILSEYGIQFIVDGKYNVKLNIIDLKENGAFVISLDRNALIIDVNDVALEMSGYSREELIGEDYFKIFIEDTNKENIMEVFLNVLSGNSNYWKYKNNIILKDGSKKLLDWSNALIKDEKKDILTVHSFGIPASILIA